VAEKEGRSDKWEKMESFAKILAGLSAVASAILIPILINSYTEKNRKAEMFVKTMTEREKSDTDIRQAMFQTLLTGYLGAIKEDLVKADEDSFRRRIMFLELLTINFQEFFNARPLFEEVYTGLERKRDGAATDSERKQWEFLEGQIIRVARGIASRQANMLNSVGNEGNVVVNLDKGQKICLRLWYREDLANLRQRDGATRFQMVQAGQCVDNRSDRPAVPIGETRRQALEIMSVEVKRSTATVRVGVYEDVFDGNVFKGSVPTTGTQFEISFFDLPYTDNTKLSDGSRFALILRGINSDDSVEVQAIRFRDDFISLKDRPLFQDMLRKLEKNGG
jgi:hypothetical protein